MQKQPNSMRLPLPLTALCALLAPSLGWAQVFEIGDSGDVRQLTGQPAPIASSTPAPRSRIAQAITTAAQRYELAPELVDAVARQESAYRQSAVSPKGAIGVMQLMPQTAKALGVDPTDIVANINGGAAYLRRMIDRFDGRIDLALAAYNAGPGAVTRHDGVPPYPETKAYVATALTRLASTSLAPSSTEETGDQP